jgi:hypothetical protein
VSLISDMIARGESVWRGEGTEHMVRSSRMGGITALVVVKATMNVSSWFGTLAWNPGVWVNVWKVFIASNNYIYAKKSLKFISPSTS